MSEYDPNASEKFAKAAVNADKAKAPTLTAEEKQAHWREALTQRSNDAAILRWGTKVPGSDI